MTKRNKHCQDFNSFILQTKEHTYSSKSAQASQDYFRNQVLMMSQMAVLNLKAI